MHSRYHNTNTMSFIDKQTSLLNLCPTLRPSTNLKQNRILFENSPFLYNVHILRNSICNWCWWDKSWNLSLNSIDLKTDETVCYFKLYSACQLLFFRFWKPNLLCL